MKHRIRSEDILGQSRVLIVDDFEPDRILMRAICQHAGFTSIEDASSGPEGLEKLRRQKPDLIVLDMEMPGMNGIEFCRTLQRHHIHDTCIIIQTALDRPADKARAFEAGITDFISKPVNLVEFRARALSHLEKRAYRAHIETDYQRLKDELAEAIMLQRVLLPSEQTLAQIKHNHGLDIAHYYQPSSEMGGDYMTVTQTGDARVMLGMVDISGHGLTAALYAFVLHTLLKDDALLAQRPGSMLNALSAKLHMLLPPGKFATMFLGMVDSDNGVLDYAAAACPRPVLFSGLTPTLLSTRGFLLGTEPSPGYKTNRIHFTPGDMLFFYSDTFTETPDRTGNCLSEEDIIALLLPHVGESADVIIQRMLSSFTAHRAAPPADDLSLMVCKR